MPPRVEGQLSDALIEGLNDPAIGLDRLGVIRVFNKAAGEVFGVKPSQAIGHTLLDVVPISDFARAFIAQIKDSCPVPVEQIMVLDGNRVFAVNISSVRTERGRNLGAVAVLRDMAGVQKIERSLDEVLNDLSRRISVPLTAIKGFVETLLEGPYQDQVITKRFLQIINQETNRLVRLVMTLEESVRANPAMPLNKTKGRLEELVSSVVEMFTPIAANKHVQLHTNFQEGLPWVDMDCELVRRAVVNLVDNAVRFTGVKGPGEVTIGVTQDGRSVVITVEDNGIGISKSDLPHVFERFYRSSLEPAASLGGTGLGLSVSQEIVEAHGGSVAIDSQLGQGCKFTVKLPIRLASNC